MRPKRTSCRIATMNVSFSGFRQPRQNPQRIQLVLKIFDFAKRNKITCLCFPSGFLTTSKIDKIAQLLTPITEKAQTLRISLILGIDLTAIFKLSPDANTFVFQEIVRKQKIPCLLASYNQRTDSLQITRQRSCTTEHVRKGLVPDEIMMTPRIMDFGKAQFQIIHCGETYDPRLFSPGMPKAGVIFGHYTMPRLSRTMCLRSASGFSLVNSEHRTQSGGMLFCYDRGISRTVHNCGKYIEQGDLWADIAVWELTGKMRFHPVHNLRG